MSARNDYSFFTDPLLMHEQYLHMCAEIDRLRADIETSHEALMAQAVIGADLARVAIEDELTTYETQLAAVSAAIEQYDAEPHPADPLVLFACVSAVAKALNLRGIVFGESVERTQ